MKKIISLCITILIAMTIFSNIIFADIGNTNRYTTDTGTTNYSNNNYSDYNSGSSSDDSWIVYLLIGMIGEDNWGVIVILLIAYAVYKSWKRKNSSTIQRVVSTIPNIVQNSTNSNSHLRSYDIEKNILETDSNFSKEEFLGFVKEVFIDIQDAWTNKKLEKIRTLETNELYNQHNRQLEEYIKKGRTNIVEKITIPNVELYSYSLDSQHEILAVELNAIMRDYVIDDKTQAVIESDPNKDWNMKYILTFVRTIGFKTQNSDSEITQTNCPNCGAPTMITNYGRCEYCGSVIESNKFGWVLNEIKSI